jgi:hypothetical protein
VATAQPILLNGPLELRSPEWWLRRLLARLRERGETTADYSAFYEGSQPLAFASRKFREVYGSRVAGMPANFMPLVVDAERERMIVQGFRVGNKQDADRGVWRIWQDNQLDAESQIAHEIALVKGEAYTMVAPGPDGPVITVEDPAETIVETAPGSRRLRLAALKVWFDDDGFARAYLYLPDAIYKFRTQQRREVNGFNWDAVTWEAFRDEDDDWPVRNALGMVPVIPLLNRPRRDGTGRSEIAPIMGNQLAINFLRFSALIGSDSAALPQRWAKNIEVPIDEQTGRPIAPFKAGTDLWVARRPTPDEVAEYGTTMPDPEFGQFPAANLAPFVDMIANEVAQMSSISRTPYHYFLGTPQSVPPSGESLKSSEAPLVKKVVAQSVHFGEGWEETMRVAMLADGQTAKARTDGETIWADPETRNEAARTDSILKQYQAGLLSQEVALEELGYSQQQIARIRGTEPVPVAPSEVPTVAA